MSTATQMLTASNAPPSAWKKNNNSMKQTTHQPTSIIRYKYTKLKKKANLEKLIQETRKKFDE